DLIGADGKNRSRGGLAKFASVFRFAAEDGPADSGADGSFRYLRKRRCAERLDNDAVGPKRRIGLNRFEYLRALRDGIVVGIDDLRIDAQIRSGGVCGGGLLHLVIVVLGDQRN